IGNLLTSVLVSFPPEILFLLRNSPFLLRWNNLDHFNLILLFFLTHLHLQSGKFYPSRTTRRMSFHFYTSIHSYLTVFVQAK
ncbi:hypothetical protein PENTCL1PPCAC_7306, partial [Pristionchus entomophagus]